jgi:putative ATP-binding cassette transporter
LYKSYDSLVSGTKELKIHRERRKAFLADLTRTAANVKELNTSGLNLYSFASNWGQSLLILTVGAMAVGGNYINSHGNPIVI